MKFFLTTACLLFLLFSVQAQKTEVTIQVVEASTGKSIENALVFLENTTIGTYTDKRGKAILRIPNDHQYILITNHILYKDDVFRITGSETEVKIILDKKSYDLGEVVISSERSKSRNYKRWMKKFKDAFLGNKKIRKKVKILNPEVLWFEEENEILKAYAIDNIKVKNELTGYIMHISLEHFSVNQDNDIRYSGRVFFEDILPAFKNQIAIANKRKIFYRQSSQLFFKTINIQHPVNEEEFEFGITKSDEYGNYSYKKKTYDDLSWRSGNYSDTLFLEDYLTIRVKDILVNSVLKTNDLNKKNKSTVELDLNTQTPVTSFLKSKRGFFIINHLGELVNKDDIEESGYWTNSRMSHELPRNYTGDVIFNDGTSREIVDHLLNYPVSQRPEKIYLHTDKSTYLPFDHLWFKGYLVNGIDHSDNTKSQVVYVDLIDQSNEVVHTWLLHTDKGLKGDMQWTAKFSPGIYRLRGYTNHMRNHGSPFFFEKEIELSSLSNASKAVDETLALDINFYPEGGDLIANITTQVTFTAASGNQNSAKITGSIVDQNGTIISNIQTTHRGVGVFTLTPQLGSSYFMKVDNVSYPLPTIQSSGLALQVNGIEDDKIYIALQSSNASLLKDAFLIGHSRGEIFSFVSELNQDGFVELDKSSIPQGLLHFTLFDGRERPQAERLVFNDYNYEESNIMDFQTANGADHLELSFSLDSIIKQFADLSISVVEKPFYPSVFTERDIKSYLLLDSDLNIHIPDLGYYLNDIDRVKRYYLDLILRCQGWRRFTWRDLKNSEEPLHVTESGYSIEGYTNVKDKEKRLVSDVLLTALGKELVVEKKRTNEDGSFIFDNLNYPDSVTYVLQARKNNKRGDDEDVTSLRGDRLLDLYANPKLSMDVDTPHEHFISDENDFKFKSEDLDYLRKVYLMAQQYDTSVWTITGPEIEVTSRKKYNPYQHLPGKFVLLDHADWISKEQTGTGLLAMVATRGRYALGPENKLNWHTTNKQGEQIVIPMQIVIDGLGAIPGEGSDASRFLSLSADNIDWIYVKGKNIAIGTRGVPRSLERSLESGIIHIGHPGYYNARTFAKVTKNKPTNISSTILWEPNINIDDQGLANILIDKKRIEGKDYVVVLEGVTKEGYILSIRR